MLHTNFMISATPAQILTSAQQFGEIAIDLGFITDEQRRLALVQQRQATSSGQPHRLLGSILLAQGRIDPGQVEQVMTVLLRQWKA